MLVATSTVAMPALANGSSVAPDGDRVIVPGQGGDPPGQRGDGPPGHSGDSPGNSGDAPGHSDDEPPGRSGDSPGKSGTPPGHDRGADANVTRSAFEKSEVATAFAPTHQLIDGYAGHTDDIVEYFIKPRETVKKHVNEGNEIIEDVDIDEQAEQIPKPDPP